MASEQYTYFLRSHFFLTHPVYIMSCQVLSPGVQECEGPVVDEVSEVVLRIVRPMLLRHPVHREGVVIVLGVANLGQGMVVISIYEDKQVGKRFLC